MQFSASARGDFVQMDTSYIGSYRDFSVSTEDARFTCWLAARAEPHWTSAANHPFTHAIGDGSMPDEAYVRYLVEDYTFITDLASTLGYLVAKAPGMRSKSRLSSFLALLTSEENDYFCARSKHSAFLRRHMRRQHKDRSPVRLPICF